MLSKVQTSRSASEARGWGMASVPDPLPDASASRIWHRTFATRLHAVLQPSVGNHLKTSPPDKDRLLPFTHQSQDSSTPSAPFNSPTPIQAQASPP